jgi:hypothetical protein
MKVWFRKLTPPDTQLSLFHSTSVLKQKRVKLNRALDIIRRRYGEDSILYSRCKGFTLHGLN